MPKLKLTRDQLAKFLPDHQAIRAFEQLFDDVDVTIPDANDEANNNAGIALAVANAALAEVANIISELQLALNAPVAQPATFPDDLAPRLEVGTIASQNADAVSITGGAIDGVTFGAVTPGSAAFTSISYSGQLTSTVATGTAPFIVTSTTKVVNLNADLLDGKDWVAPGPIGGTTPDSGSFTTISVSSQITSTQATGTPPLVIASTTKVSNLNVDLLDSGDWASPGAIGATTPAAATFTALSTNGTADVNLGADSTNSAVNIRGSSAGTGGGTVATIRNNNVAIISIGNKSAILGTAYDATPYIFGNSTIEVHNGVKFLSTVGFNGTSPIAKPTVTGSRGGNAALASLLTALANYGLVTDSSTA